MITLITGVPGSGKTLYAVSQILLPESKTDRPIFVDNIPELIPRHEVAPDILDWPNWAPVGAHIFIDEVQRVWRPEAAGKAIHPSIAELETHRHRGLDFTIMTQHPSLVHSNVRRLVGKHIHVRRTALGVKVYEYSECQANPDTAWRNALTKLSWKHPKSAFGLYKSSSLHVKVKFRIPGPVKVLAVCVVAIGALGYYMFDRLWSIGTGATEQPQLVQSAVQGAGLVSSMSEVSTIQGHIPSPQNQSLVAREVDIRETFIPRVHGEPNTAPAYDHLRQVVTMPVVAACISDAERCMCYTQQMTKVEMTDSQCRERVQRGEFDPYRQATEERAVRGELADLTPQTET